MRLVLDTNILVSALISPGAPAGQLYQAWRDSRFTLVTSEEQLDEYQRVTRHPRIRKYIRAAEAGTTLNEIRLLATVLHDLPGLDCSSDPGDNFLLAMASAGQVDYLVTGDRKGVLSLGRYERTRIVTVRRILEVLAR